MSAPKLLVTDLDNTLYDWVTFFSYSFGDMIAKLVEITGIDRNTLVTEFKAIHQRYGNSEHPFSVLELPSLHRHFDTADPAKLIELVDPALHAFNRSRKAHFKLYPTVEETLRTLTRRGVIVVGHTEATLVNAYWRLQKLDIAHFFRRLYVLEGHISPHPDASRGDALRPPIDFVRVVPKAERKPNPGLLLDICAREEVLTKDTVYVGDSLTRDISMAKKAGVPAVWARYGTVYDQSLWSLLVSITHWTDEDVKREGELKRNFANIKPDFVIDEYAQLERIIFDRAEQTVRGISCRGPTS